MLLKNSVCMFVQYIHVCLYVCTFLFLSFIKEPRIRMSLVALCKILDGGGGSSSSTDNPAGSAYCHIQNKPAHHQPKGRDKEMKACVWLKMSQNQVGIRRALHSVESG